MKQLQKQLLLVYLLTTAILNDGCEHYYVTLSQKSVEALFE
ncbi:hypothetical protein OL548_32605 [Lysinibacillus sp. MHQ-1]|nr:hypothetical protein OL548_32605 [Lysinibacillus sp. MHQ-1]